MKTSQLIQDLSRNLEQSRTPSNSGEFVGKCFSLGIALALGIFMLIPPRVDLAERIARPAFVIEALLWLGLAVASTVGVHRSAHPGSKIGGAESVAITLLTVVVLALAMRANWTDLGTELQSEMNYYKGRCGIGMTAVTVAGAFALLRWARSQATTMPGVTALWAAMAAGSFSSFLIMAVCAHENSTHILVWHLAPVVFLAWIFSLAGRALLRWR